MVRQMTAIIEREGEFYVALCPELDIASQGASVSEARSNLKEALELFYETASDNEIQRRRHDEVYVTHVEVAVAQRSPLTPQPARRIVHGGSAQ